MIMITVYIFLKDNTFVNLNGKALRKRARV
jgi:peptidyl-tRNA hydrolase